MEKYENFIKEKNNGSEKSAEDYIININETIRILSNACKRIFFTKVAFYFGFWIIRFFSLEFIFYLDIFFYFLVLTNISCIDCIYSRPKSRDTCSIILVILLLTIIELRILYYLF